jgi:hypothetical protein
MLTVLVVLLTLSVKASTASATTYTRTRTRTIVEEEDPCSAHTNCGSCTFSRFQYNYNRKNSILHESTLSSDTSSSSSSYSSPLDVLSRPTCHWCIPSSTCYSPSLFLLQHPNDTFCRDHDDNHDDDDDDDNHDDSNKIVSYEYDCPLGPIPYPDQPPTFLPHWMHEFYTTELLEHTRLIDLSLPGSHDSLSYHLSLTISEDGMDHLTQLVKLLHRLSGGTLHLLPGDMEEFFRMQAKTQQLSITQQLDNGIRFLDLRIMYESDTNTWYSMHFMQSKHPVQQYLQQIRHWLDAHPHEIIVIWLSKHGSTTDTGQAQYPGVTPQQKQQFWNMYCHMFQGLLQSTNETSIFTTSVADLIRNNHRVISYVSDYQQFTQASSPQLKSFALDAATIQNTYDGGDGVFDAHDMVQTHLAYFHNATENNARINAKQGFTLLAMNTASPSWQVISAAKHQFLHWWLHIYKDDYDNYDTVLADTTTQQQDNSSYRKHIHHLPLERRTRLRRDHLLNQQRGPRQTFFEAVCHLATALHAHVLYWLGLPVEQSEKAELEAGLFSSCSSHIKIPGIDHWCPQNLLDIAQLASFYNQIAVEQAFQNTTWNATGTTPETGSAFPNAFYIDSIDFDGTIRIGPQLLDGSERGDMNNNDTLATKHAKYAFVDTILAYNARLSCANSRIDWNNCTVLETIMQRRNRYPLRRWNEPSLGRHDDWPPYSDVTKELGQS